MARVTFNEQRCKGCGLCVEFCPKKIVILDEKMNNLGYRYAVVNDMNSCTGCGICAVMCPDVIIEVKEA